MGKSYRHTNIIGNCGGSEKNDKRLANRCLRRLIKVAIQEGQEDIFPIMREITEVWAFQKDGKCYFGTQEEFMERHMSRVYHRHDEEYWSKTWRKMKNK